MGKPSARSSYSILVDSICTCTIVQCSLRPIGRQPGFHTQAQRSNVIKRVNSRLYLDWFFWRHDLTSDIYDFVGEALRRLDVQEYLDRSGVLQTWKSRPKQPR